MSQGDQDLQHRPAQQRVPPGDPRQRVILRIDQDFGVTPGKLDELKARIARLGIDPAKIEESFSRGGGKGGQKVNKTANRVQLYYPPLELRVACHRERSRSLNRFYALRELTDQAEMKLSPETSARLAEMRRIRKNKSRARARTLTKTVFQENA